jgi:hypothetical protein
MMKAYAMNQDSLGDGRAFSGLLLHKAAHPILPKSGRMSNALGDKGLLLKKS